MFIEELGLSRGHVRVDVAVVNGSLHGYEIKSDLRDGVVDLGAAAFLRNEVPVPLTTGELELFRLLYVSPTGLTTKTIVEKLEKSEGSVAQDLSRLRKKLGRRNLVSKRHGPKSATHRLVRRDDGS